MNKGTDLSGLDDFKVSSFLTGAKPPKDGVLVAPIENFNPDERNARTIFDDEGIDQLVDSMLVINEITNKPRGILQPLSVKKDTDNDGYFIINGGHRRLIAAKKAGLTEIPYFISDNTNHFDNVVDNLIREGLKTKDLANFIKEALEEGFKPGDIAKKLGKPVSFISDYSIYFDMMDEIRVLQEKGLCESIQNLAMLHRASKKFPEEIRAFVQSEAAFTFNKIRAFVKGLKDKKIRELEDNTKTNNPTKGNEVDSAEGEIPQKKAEQGANQILAQNESDKIKNPFMLVVYDKREAVILIKQRVAYGMVAIKYQDEGQELVVPVNEVSLSAIIEG